MTGECGGQIFLIDLGMMDYKETWELQKNIHRRRSQDKIPDTLLLVEHNPVVTMGKSGKNLNLLVSQKLLKEKGIEFYQIERGGDVTFHGPGQLVGYPIFNVKSGLAGIKPYIHKIEEVIIQSLADFNIKGFRKEKMIGVWTETGKICSIGLAVQKWISFHGFAMNVNTDLRSFDLIVPCGLKDIRMTSMQEILKNELPMEQVKNGIVMNFKKVFEKNLIQKCLADVT